jgi:hypothetical protein
VRTGRLTPTSGSYAAFAVARRRAAIQTAASAKAANTTFADPRDDHRAE